MTNYTVPTVGDSIRINGHEAWLTVTATHLNGSILVVEAGGFSFPANIISEVAVEDPTHNVVILGGHSLYCATCDKVVARLQSPGAKHAWKADKTHEREVLTFARGGIRWSRYPL